MGYWPSKIAVLLNIVIMVGYGMIDCVIAGQMLSAVSGGSMSIIVGIVIVAFISWVIAVFGMAVFHHYERYDSANSRASTWRLIAIDGPSCLNSLFYLSLSALLAQSSILLSSLLATT
jgi:purine-cytosine permease-like protein